MTTGSARVGRAAFALALLAGVAPLCLAPGSSRWWTCPQHLHLISVLHRLDDPTTLYPQVFAARGELTPYLGYYDTVSLLSWVVPLELANRLFLTALVAGLPLAMAFLLRSLGRPRWPAVLTLPFAYGDSFGWGFVNSSASFVLALLAAGLFVRALIDVPAPPPLGAGPGGGAPGGAADARPGLPLPRPRPALPAAHHRRARGRDPACRVRPRLPAVLSTLPAVSLFLVWGAGRLLAPAEVEEGAPWKAWGPLLSAPKPVVQARRSRTSTSSPRCWPTSSATVETAGGSGRSP